MRISTLLLVLLGASAWYPDDDPRPKKGDEVVAKGCLGGGVLETLDISSPDGKKRYLAPVSLRLTGDKKLLKTLKEEHADHSDTLTGVLKTDLPDERRTVGGRIGNTGIGIGIVDRNASNQRALPVLEVKEFEHADVRCR